MCNIQHKVYWGIHALVVLFDEARMREREFDFTAFLYSTLVMPPSNHCKHYLKSKNLSFI